MKWLQTHAVVYATGHVNSRIQNDVQIETVGIGEHTRNGSSEMIAEADEPTGRKMPPPKIPVRKIGI